MVAADGKNRQIVAANAVGILRIVQSIPSPKAEPFKDWLARIGSERIDETIDPEQAIDRALETYLKKYTKMTYIAQYQSRRQRRYPLPGAVMRDHRRR